jgi:hypothetical protein
MSNVTEWLEKAKQQFKREPVQLHVLTPCYGGVVHTNFVQCFFETNRLLSVLGVTLKLDLLRNESLVTRARNNMVARAMNDKTMTHILFIDSDITWSAMDVVKLLLNGHDISGGVYPKKKYYWDRLTEERMDKIKELQQPGIDPVDFIRHHLVDYNCNLLGVTNQVNNGCMEVLHLATGFMMIRRGVFDRMFEHMPETKYTDDCGLLTPDQNKYAYALFDCAVIDDHYYSEDWLFCHRWKNMGGKIFADVTISLAHTGIEDFVGRMQSTLKFSQN